MQQGIARFLYKMAARLGQLDKLMIALK